MGGKNMKNGNENVLSPLYAAFAEMGIQPDGNPIYDRTDIAMLHPAYRGHDPFRRKRKIPELWENLTVIWRCMSFDKLEDPVNAVLNGNLSINISLVEKWYVTRIVNHNASCDPKAEHWVNGMELAGSMSNLHIVDGVDSKEEALLQYATLGGVDEVWAVENDEIVSNSIANGYYGGANLPTVGWQDCQYRLVRVEI